MEDINSINDGLITKENTLVTADAKVARFAYTKTSYDNDNADGVAEYAYENEQNIPLATEDVLETSATTLNKGLRAQASSIPRLLLNHFFGRMSYNLNKVNDVFSAFLISFKRHLAQDNHAYSSTATYFEGDTCFVNATITVGGVSYSTNRGFRCKDPSGSGIMDSPPITDGVVDTVNWQESNIFNDVYAKSFHGSATAIDDGTVSTAKIVDSNITTAKIADSNITTAKLNDSSVITTKLADDSVTTTKVVDLNITEDKLAIDTCVAPPVPAILFSCDDIPEYPDRASATYMSAEDWVNGLESWNSSGIVTCSIVDGYLHAVNDGTHEGSCRIIKQAFTYAIQGKLCKIRIRSNFDSTSVEGKSWNGTVYTTFASVSDVEKGKWYTVSGIVPSDSLNTGFISIQVEEAIHDTSHSFDIDYIYIGDGTTSQPLIDNINGENNATLNGVLSAEGVSGKCMHFLAYKSSQVDLSDYANVQSWWHSRWIYAENATTNSTTNPWFYGGKDYCTNFDSIGTGDFYAYSYNGTTSLRVTIARNSLMDGWHHIVVQTIITSSTSATKKVYLDSSLCGTATSTEDFTDLKFTDQCFNGGNNLTYSVMNGYQDDIMFGVGEITDEQVKNIYRARGQTKKYYTLANLKSAQNEDDIASEASARASAISSEASARASAISSEASARASADALKLAKSAFSLSGTTLTITNS